jgi:hypothetical protein
MEVDWVTVDTAGEELGAADWVWETTAVVEDELKVWERTLDGA